MENKKTDFRDFVEISKANLDKIPANIFVTEEADPAKAIPAIIDAVREGKYVAAVWLHDYWAEERALFRQLEKEGPIDVKYLHHTVHVQPLTAEFNDKAESPRQKLKARIAERQQTLEDIARRHCDPNFCEYIIQGGQGKDFFDVRSQENFHLDQSNYFMLSFIGTVSGPGTWFVSPEDTKYYKAHPGDDITKPQTTHGYLGTENPVLYGVPQGALLVMPSGDGGPNDGKWLLHTTPFDLSVNGHEFRQGEKRIFERFTLSGPDHKWAAGPKTDGPASP
jgi:hypothetical protein